MKYSTVGVLGIQQCGECYTASGCANYTSVGVWINGVEQDGVRDIHTARFTEKGCNASSSGVNGM